MVHVFNTTIENILSKFIPHETIICDHNNLPLNNTKMKTEFKKRIKLCVPNENDNQSFEKFQLLQTNKLSGLKSPDNFTNSESLKK